jgi:hypothetical protein
MDVIVPRFAQNAPWAGSGSFFAGQGLSYVLGATNIGLALFLYASRTSVLPMHHD